MIKYRHCQQCGRRFQGTGRALYCSNACRSKSYRRRAQQVSQKIGRYCRQCKRPFVQQADGQLFCSEACRQRHMRKHRHDTGLVNGRPVLKQVRAGMYTAYDQHGQRYTIRLVKPDPQAAETWELQHSDKTVFKHRAKWGCVNRLAEIMGGHG